VTQEFLKQLEALRTLAHLALHLVGSQLRWTKRLIVRKDCDYEMETQGQKVQTAMVADAPLHVSRFAHRQPGVPSAASFSIEFQRDGRGLGLWPRAHSPRLQICLGPSLLA